MVLFSGYRASLRLSHTAFLYPVKSSQQATKVLRPPNGGRMEWLAGGGEMGKRIRSFDWDRTPLGPPEQWPQSLRTVVRLMLDSRYPMFVWWGPELTILYNDGYTPIFGKKHPAALGQPARHVWSEIWPNLAAQVNAVMVEGRASWNEESLLFVERNGFTEEAYFTWSYSPVWEESGKVGGLFCACTEETAKVIGKRRLNTLRELAAKTAEAKTAAEACALAAQALAGNPHDLPFALLYLLSESGERAELLGTSGITANEAASPRQVAMADAGDAPGSWPLQPALQSGQGRLVDGLPEQFGRLPGGPWPESPSRALVVPIAKPGLEQPAGFLIAALSPRRPCDDDYRAFISLVAGQVATALADARAYESERKRAEALAELDRAKTAFFSNVSHEFRTPLTLMLGPLEELKAQCGRATSNLDTSEYQQIDLIHRNGLRLLKLVNTLLDFSRIEAGRVQALYEATDLATLTAELASIFRSAIEKAGLNFLVDCPPLPEPIFVDREMWEKIVLNLLSNAFKFTFAGEIEVKLQQSGKHAELCVRDTGIGIPGDQVGRLFERFHRVPGAQGRTHEGTGIGLALVQELARLHGGSVSVESAYGKGTTFHVFIPFGKGHLLQKQVGTRKTSPSVASAAFIEEARRWSPAEVEVTNDVIEDISPGAVPAKGDLPVRRARILLADDNSDMREYVRRLLTQQGHEVIAVPDGQAALSAVREQIPDLVLTDIMMPRLDGFGLLRELRADEQTRTIPIILLSARAGEEARVEGVSQGADDYLTKPFSARELLARVGTHLELARVRREAQQRVTNILESLTDGFWVVDPTGRLAYMNPAARRMLAGQGLNADDLMGKHVIDEAFPEARHDAFGEAFRQASAERKTVSVENFYKPWQRWYAVQIYPNPEGGLSIYFQDITDRKQAENLIQQREHELRVITDAAPALISFIGADQKYRFVNRAYENWFGHRQEDVIGKTMTEVLGESAMERLRPNVDRVLRGEDVRFEVEVTYRHGGTRWVRGHYVPNRDATGGIQGFFVLVLDITEAKRAELALRESEVRFRNISNHSPMMLWMTDPSGHCTHLNQRWYEFTGQTSETALGFGWFRAVHFNDRQTSERTFLAANQKREPFRLEYRLRRHDGEYRWVIDTASPRFSETGEFLGYIGSVIDIQERKSMEEALRGAHELLADKAKHLDSLVQERTAKLNDTIAELQSFSYTIAHDMRAPLRGMQGFATFLMEDCADRVGPEGKQYISRIVTAADRMDRLIQDVLNYSKMAHTELTLEPVDLNKLLHGILDSYPDFQPPKANVTVDGQLSPVLGNQAALTQCISNLLSNAVKFVARGVTPQIRIWSEEVQATGHPALRLFVQDNGIGIDKSAQTKLFGMFQRLSASYEGTGIGLVIVKKAVERMGGSVGFDSYPGRGSTFWLQLPKA